MKRGPIKTVYPRVCGGTRRPRSRPRQRQGLSPRVRGNLNNLPKSSLEDRSIPACAGNRIRGDVGSNREGSIPACAGEPFNKAYGKNWYMVYPRVCGGTPSRYARRFQPTGLSPRVRGNQACPPRFAIFVRSIPACAGEPAHWRFARTSSSVYPRVCGGTDRPTRAGRHVDGLSPRVRGNRVALHLPRINSGSIPACAGEPEGYCELAEAGGVYPRVCGGTPKRPFFVNSAEGYDLIVLHQVDPVSIHDLLGRLSKNPYALTTHR